MAQPNTAQVVSQYPLPPRRYYKDAPPATPPPPPPEGTAYAMFGRVYTTEDELPSLTDSGRACLYDPDAPPCAELRRLNRALLALFSHLVRALCAPQPTDQAPLIQRIEDTFVNMQHLINIMRPIQAAMDLKTLLDRQSAARATMTDKLKTAVADARALVRDAAKKLGEPSAKLSEGAGGTVENTDSAMRDVADAGDGEGAAHVRKLPKYLDPDIVAEVERIIADPTL